MNPFKAFGSILNQHISEKAIPILERNWRDNSRHYHSITHLVDILKSIEKNIHFNELTAYEKHVLVIAAFFHDAIYDVKKNNNEDESIRFFKTFHKGSHIEFVDDVCGLIEVTKYRQRPFFKLKKIFWDADNSQFYKSFANFIKIDKEIRKEYPHVSDKDYKEARIKFLESCKGLFNSSVDIVLDKMIEYIKKTY